MSFVESPRFPDTIAFSAQGGPGFSTNVVTLASGFEARNINWSQTRYEFDLAIPPRDQTEVNEINAFFRNMQGKALGFRFRDWSDFEAMNAPTESITTTEFQLLKSYVSGSYTNTRAIKKPVPGTVVVYVGGTEQTSGFTLDTATGVITFSSAPSGTVTWSGQFDVPVRFDTDTLQWRVIDKSLDSLMYQADKLPLVEVRL